MQEELTELLRLVGAGRLSAEVHHRLGWTDVAAAADAMNHRAMWGKTVLDVT